jgi:hypothetical protein
MNSRKIQQHTIDFIFPVALLFVFAASSLVVLLLAANIYRHTTRASLSHFESGTALAYITEKIRQNDEGGTASVYLDSFDGCTALVMEQSYNGSLYRTYIYESGGSIRELFIRDGVHASASDGTELIQVSSFTMEEAADGLYLFTCCSQEGEWDTALVGVHSR